MYQTVPIKISRMTHHEFPVCLSVSIYSVIRSRKTGSLIRNILDFHSLKKTDNDTAQTFNNS